MIIKTKISFKEYCKLLFTLIYKRGILKIILGVAFAMLLWILGFYFHFLSVPKPEIYQYITLSLILIVQPLVIYGLIKRNYISSNFLAEHLNIEITRNEMKIRGDSFYTELIWKNIFKIKEEKNYLLIYQNTLSAIIISKKQLTTTEWQELKSILKGIPDVAIHLKKSSNE